MKAMWWVFLIGALVPLLIWFLYWNRKWHREIRMVMRSVELDDLESAQNHLARAYEAVKNLEPEDPRVLIVRLEEARLVCLRKEFEVSSSIIENVIQLCNPEKKIYKNIYSRALLNLAETKALAGDDVESEHLFVETLNYRERNYGMNSRDMALALNRYADFLVERQRFDEAKKLLDRGWRIIGKSGDLEYEN